MSDEGHKFTPGPQAKFPRLIMRAFTSTDTFAEWDFTPPDGGGWFEYKFEAKQENGVLFVNFDAATLMTPKAG